MAAQGLCSRREADEYIQRGWVRVDGERADTLGMKIFPNQRIELDERARNFQTKRMTLLLNKPVGYVSSQPEKGYPPAVELIRPDTRWEQDPSGIAFQPGHLLGLAPAGRLDIDSQGLLVLTQDGRVAKRLIGENTAEWRRNTWCAWKGSVPPPDLRTLHHGLALDNKPLRPAPVRMAESATNCVHFERRPQAPDPAHVRTGRAEGHGLEARAHRPRGPGRPAQGQWRYLGRDERF